MPPQSVPSVLLDQSSGLTNAAGFVDVNPSTLQHVKHSNVFAIGDCSSTPNSKTMAAIGNDIHSWLFLNFLTSFVCICRCVWRCVLFIALSFTVFTFSPPFLAGQVGVLHKNIKKYLSGQSLDASYDGYASCPLVTGYDTCIMAEFDYNLQPKETFPFRQDCERYSMYVLKRDFMPMLYWHLMLNGHWNGPEPMRKIFSLFKRS